MKKIFKDKKPNSHLFYICYFLLIIGYGVGMLCMYAWLNNQLVTFEAAAQPNIKSEEIFQGLFADPDWSVLYDTAGLTDTPFEGRDAFVTAMTDWVSEDALTFEEAEAESQLLVYNILLREEQIGTFSLINQAKSNSRIPDWTLYEVSIQPKQSESVSILLLEGHTAYVNGQPLDSTYTQEIRSTAAESYLPAGTRGVRLLLQEVTGLMTPPEVTVCDEEGQLCSIVFDEETGIYTEILPNTEPMSKALQNRAIAAGEVYCGFLVNRGTGLLSSYFAPGSDAYRQITALPRWHEWQPDLEFSNQKLSEYTRYTEDLFSVRVSMTAELSFRYDPDPFDDQDDPSTFLIKTENRSMDTVFFFEHRKNGWMVTGMTNDDTTIPTSRVRLTFQYGESCLSTAFYDSTDGEIYAPLIATADGQILAGWANMDRSTIFTCDESGLLAIPDDTVLHPMILYPVFE